MSDCIIQANGITMRSSDHFAGAFDSLVWNGKEFLNNADHGRELQSACAFDDLGEAYNPTEAGSGNGTPSILLARECEGNRLRAQTQMAYWKPVNGVVISNHILTRDVTIGHPAGGNIIQYAVAFHNPENHSYGQFEALTGYMPPEFSDIYKWEDGQIQRIETNVEQWDIPGIMSTADGAYAMGCYTNQHIGIYTGFVDADVINAGCVKWNMVFREQPCPAGDYAYQMYVIVGTLEEVRVTMGDLHNYLNAIPDEGGETVNGDDSDRYLRFKPYDESLGFNYASDQWFNDVSAARRVYLEQGELMGVYYKEARKNNQEYADYLYNLWVTGQDDTQNLLDVMKIVAEQTPPLPDSLPQRPGPFFMSGMPFPDGLRIGTYKDNQGIARLLKFNGAFSELWKGPCESVYMIQRRKNGRVMFSTECPAGIVYENADGTFGAKQLRGEVDSLAFDIWPYRGGWMVFTVSNILYGRIKIFTSQDDGETWQLYKEHTCQDGIFKQCCTDGDEYYLVGHKDRFPYIEREDGKQTIWMKDYKDQEINYASVKDDLFTLGMNNIDPLISDGTRRNGYVMWATTGGTYHSGIDLHAPWIMQTDIDPVTGNRYALASIWNESGYPQPELAMSKNGRDWSCIFKVPMDSVQTMDIADGGAYFYGGKYGEYAAAYFLKV